VLRITGYEIEERAAQGESGDGAWFAVDRRGREVVLKWTTDLTALPRFEAVGAMLEALRAAGAPVPRYVAVEVIDDLLVVAQERLEGRADVPVNERTVADVLAINELQVNIEAHRDDHTWAELIRHTLTVGEDGWCMHEPLRTWSSRTRALLERAVAIGDAADPAWFPTTGAVHFDLHPGNLLLHDDGSIAGVVDWEGATAGDHRFDLTSFAFCHEVEGAFRGPSVASMRAVWAAAEATIDERALQAYAAHQAVRLVDWMIRHHTPADVDRWLDAGEAMLARYS
jgi:aminoglycoside phosphotransferase (APT) family kinase protein